MKRILAPALAIVLALALAPVAVAARPSSAFGVTSADAGKTPHFPAFDPATGNVLVSNPSTDSVTEVAPATGPVRTFAVGDVPHTVAVDDDARRAYVVNKGGGSVSVIDLIGGGVTSFLVGPNPHGLALDERRNRLFVTSIDADRVEAYDLTTHAFVGRAAVGDGPWGVDVRGDRLVVANTGGSTVSILDPDTLAVERQDLAVGAGPWNVKLGESGTLYVTLERAGQLVAVRGDGRIRWRRQIGPSPHGLVVDEDRHVVMAAVTGANQVAVVRPRSGRMLPPVGVPAGPAGMTYDFATGRAFAGAQAAERLAVLTPRR